MASPARGALAAGLVAFGLSLDDRVDPLVPALQQPLLLTIHVGTAALSYAMAGVAFVAAVAEIAQRAAGDRIGGLPSSATARALGHRAVLIAFPILTIAIALGSVWANLAWRSYWSNDPKELAAAATWLVFGAYLHVAGRRDRLRAPRAVADRPRLRRGAVHLHRRRAVLRRRAQLRDAVRSARVIVAIPVDSERDGAVIVTGDRLQPFINDGSRILFRRHDSEKVFRPCF